MRLVYHGLLATALLVAALLWPAAADAQCAMCRTALDSPEGRQLIAALRSGILFLLAVPLATFATVAWIAVRGQRRLAAPDDTTGNDPEAP